MTSCRECHLAVVVRDHKIDAHRDQLGELCVGTGKPIDHQCTLKLTWDKKLPFRAECWCGWHSQKYPHTRLAGEAAANHCNDMNKGD